MSKQEVLITPMWEFLDLLACLSVYNGNAKQITSKKITRITTIEDLMLIK